MIIKTLKFKNFKSYGNKTQEILFNNKGGLTLLIGGNGSGKSSILECVNLVLYNQVSGKYNNKMPLKSLPNRTNKNLEVSIDFDNYKNDSIQITRKIEPNFFSISVNNQDYTERFKLLNQDERENIIGFNYETFRSFISLSMNDFLNFIDMKSEDKRNLLNRLFNLERIDDYLSITKELISQNKKEMERISIDVININKELKNYITIIQNNNNIVNTTKEDLKKIGIDTKKKFDSLQLESIDLSNKISDFHIKIQEQRNYISSTNNENIKRKTELSEIKNKIKIFELGNCPYCSSGLNDHDHILMLNQLKETDILLSDNIITNDKKISYYQEENRTIGQECKILENSKSMIDEQLSDIKSELKRIKNEFDNYEKSDNFIIEDLKTKGILLKKEKKVKIDRITELKKDIDELFGLSKVLSDTGARKTIMDSLIPPINQYLIKLLKSINFPYEVKLNNNFDAEIYDKGETIHNESPSNGEIRMLNICIAISYIQMVRKMKNINILFMDEVFQSVHKDNINLLLILLKNFAIENDLHLILIHHGLEEVDSSFFNRIISVEKNMFSDIKIV